MYLPIPDPSFQAVPEALPTLVSHQNNPKKTLFFFVYVPLNVKVMMNLQYMLYNLVISSRELDKYVYENVRFFFFFILSE